MFVLYVFNKSSKENLLKYQLDSSCVTMSSILMTTVFYRAVILKGEIWHWSLLGLKGLTENEVLCSQYGKPVTAPNTTKSESQNLQVN